MKALTYVFWTAVAGIVVAFAMNIGSVISAKKARDEALQQPVALPAEAQPNAPQSVPATPAAAPTP